MLKIDAGNCGKHAHAIPSLLLLPEGRVVRGGNQCVRIGNNSNTFVKGRLQIHIHVLCDS